MMRNLTLTLLLCVVHVAFSQQPDSIVKRAAYRVSMDSMIMKATDKPSAAIMFAALYAQVMDGIDSAMSHGRFEDTTFIQRLQASFAGRFIQAATGADRPMVWQHALSDDGDETRSPFRRLLLCINAHVDHDLLLSIVEVAETGFDLQQRRPDFDLVFGILDQVLRNVVRRYRHELGRKDIATVISFSQGEQLMRDFLFKSRDALYARAVTISKDPATKERLMAEQEAVTERYEQLILHPTGTVRLLMDRIDQWFSIPYPVLLVKVLWPDNFQVISER